MKNLPTDLNDAIFSIKTFETLKVYWVDFKLDDKQKKELGGETGLYMAGKTKKENFLPNLMFKLDINRSTAENIAARIEKEIIDPVRASFEKVQNGEVIIPTKAEPKKEITAKTPTQKTPEVSVVPTPEPRHQPKPTTPVQNPAPAVQSHTDIPVVAVKEESASVPVISGNAQKEPVSKPNVPNKADILLVADKAIASVKPPVEAYSNDTPLNIIKEDVLNEIENPTLQDDLPIESKEGTALDSKLDQILRKARSSEPPKNLPTEPEHSEPSADQALPETKTPPAQRGPYQGGQDPYREAIE
jgi:hypothetical protein